MSEYINDKLHKDTLLTIVIGPIKFIVPTISFLLLYPIIMSRSSIAAVGIWSLFASIVTFVNVADIGFSQLLTREAGLDLSLNADDVIKDYVAAKRAYYIILCLLSLTFIILKDYFLAIIGSSYPTDALIASVLMLLLGSIIQLMGKLDAAILSAWHENVTVQVATAISPVFMYTISLVGAWFRRPIEGMSLGTIVSGVVTLAILNARIHKVRPDWHRGRTKILLIDSLKRLPNLLHRGWYLYSSSIGLLIRGPIYRFIIASFLGLQTVATFDIAMRVTQMAREVVASGFSVLYPTFGYYYRSKDHVKIIYLIRISLFILLGGGTLLIGILVVGGEQILKLWLGLVPIGSLTSIRLLGFWQILTLLNVPFWYLLQAAHLEKVASFSIWAHTVLIIALIPLGRIIPVNLDFLLEYWILSSILTQFFIYYYAHTKLNAFGSVFRSTRMGLVLVLSAIYTYLFYYVFTISNLVVFGVVSTIYICILCLISFRPIKTYMVNSQLRSV